MSRNRPYFADLNLDDFWETDEDALGNENGPPLTDELVAEVEEELGYKLPASYVELMRSRNGGTPRKTAHRTAEPTSWADDHVRVTSIFSIGFDGDTSLCGELGSTFWMDEWGYPDIGVYFADCPSAGHDMFCLDYRACGPDGEPQVVHIDQEDDYRIVFVAENFEAFIRGLEDESVFDPEG